MTAKSRALDILQIVVTEIIYQKTVINLQKKSYNNLVYSNSMTEGKS